MGSERREGSVFGWLGQGAFILLGCPIAFSSSVRSGFRPSCHNPVAACHNSVSSQTPKRKVRGEGKELERNSFWADGNAWNWRRIQDTKRKEIWVD